MNDSNANIKVKAINGMIWSSMGSFMFQIVRILTQIVLARLLWPEAFGLLAIVMAFVSVANYLIENGLTLFLIRKKDLNENDSTTLFIANIVFAIIMFISFLLISPFLSLYFNDESLGLMLRVTSISILFNALGSVHKALLTRQIEFKGQTIISLISAVVSGFLAIITAYIGWGIWSLVFYNILYQVIQTVLLLVKYRYFPKGSFDYQFFKEAVTYSWKLMLSGLIHTIYENIFSVIMAGLYSVTSLGYYSNALKIRDGAAQTLTDSIQRVSFPVLSTFQDEKERLKQTNRTILKLSVFIIFPLLIGLAATSSTIINVVFGDLWLGMIPVMQVLAFNGLLIPLHKINLNVLTVIGRTDLYLKLEIIKKIVAVITIGIALFYKINLIGLLWVLFLNAIIGYVLNAYYTEKYINYGLREQMSDILNILITSLVMGSVVYGFDVLTNLSNLITLIIQVLIGVTIYVSLGYLLCRKEFDYVVNIVKKILLKIRS